MGFKIALITLFSVVLLCWCEDQHTNKNLQNARIFWGSPPKFATNSNENLEIASKVSLPSSEKDSTSNESGEYAFERFMKIQHDTDPVRAGNGRQKLNQVTSRSGAMRTMSADEDDVVINQIHKN